MTPSRILIVTALSTVCVLPVFTQPLPYNPTFLVAGQDSGIYQFSATASPQFAVYNITNAISATDSPAPVTSSPPFLFNSSDSFVPVAVSDGIQVFTGECSSTAQELSLWGYKYASKGNGWTQIHTTSTAASISANFLSAAFAFPSFGNQTVDTLYVFGGMCPLANAAANSWTTDATYSNTMLTITMEATNDYEVALTGQRAPPVAEAGLSITPLSSSTVGSSLQQNFVLVGGHTQTAFIDMSQIAMFSLPEQAWAFIGVDQPSGQTVEPRSGHTAVISQDGSQIVVFGGWVGNVSTPASPQLIILHVGQGYGGNGSWAWTVPQPISSPLGTNQGLYGHGAVMLPGDIMMVTGGNLILSTTSKTKRDIPKLMFYNTSSQAWTSSYTNPQRAIKGGASATNFSRSEKAGLGVGLGLGVGVLIICTVIISVYFSRKRQAKLARERALREMALGTDCGGSVRAESRATHVDTRSVSWGARQEQQIETVGPKQPWFSMNLGRNIEHPAGVPELARVVDRSGAMLDIPSPTRGLRKNLHARGPPGFGSSQHPPSNIPRIDEEDEDRSQKGSIKRLRYSHDGSALQPSDPFKDPPVLLPTDEAAKQRREEVQKWVEDWTSAAQTMNMSRTPSKANSRAYSSLSANYTSSSSDKSDRTGSNLSEKSNRSNLSTQRSATGTVSRNLSQRSASAGYALFAGASVALSRMAGRPQDPHTVVQNNLPSSGINRVASKRSISTGDLAQLAARKRSNSVEQKNTVPYSRNNTLTPYEEEVMAEFWTPPESPIKDYKKNKDRSSSLTNSSRKALGALSQVKRRVLTGTGHVNVADKVDDIENRSGQSSPTKTVGASDMSEYGQKEAASTGVTFWKHKQGAKDWNTLDPQAESSRDMRRRSGRAGPSDEQSEENLEYEEDEDWDPEEAIQQRVVQVMFTVPKEKLRVVNADTLSLVSRSDTNASRESRKSVQGIIEGPIDEIAEQDDEGSSSTRSMPAIALEKSSLYLVGHPPTREDNSGLLQKQKSGDTVGTIGKAL